MDLNAKAAYIKGLMEGMEFDATTKEGKVIAAMMDLLTEMADTVNEHDAALDQVYDELDAMDEDLDDLENFLMEDDDEDEADEDEEAEYELTCPKCGAATTVDEETLMSEQIYCPNCGAAFDIQFTEDEETESDEK